VTEAACVADGGAYRGNNTDCSDLAICLDELTIFSYDGGACPDELTVKDGSPDNVECGVPRSRLFDDNSPLDGSNADVPDGGFGTFPGADGSDDTGMLVRLDGFASDPNDDRANIVVICLNIVIPPHPGSFRAVKCHLKRAAGFKLTPEAQAVVDTGKRNHWAQQARKLAKLEADAAGGVDPKAAKRADRLRRVFSRKNNTDYDTLVDGTRYMEETEEWTDTIEIDPPTPGATLTFYLVFVGDAFSSLGEFIPQLDIALARDPDAGSPSMGSIDDNALVIESVDEVGPVAVADFADGMFTPNLIDLMDPANANPEDAVWIINSSDTDLALTVPGHPDLLLPPEMQVSFNDLGDAMQIVGDDGSGNLAILNLQQPTSEPFACCIGGTCNDTFPSQDECTLEGGTAVTGATCSDNPCAADTSPLGIWVDTPGTYIMQNSTCPQPGASVDLVEVNGTLVLQNFPENGDITLTLNDTATASGVTAFGNTGHDLTISMVPGGLQLQLVQPETFASCSTDLIPQ